MSESIVKRVTVVAAIMLATVCFFSSCSELENKGTPPKNSPPEVFLANVPIEGSEWLQNPVIHWYATDGDGYITTYRYTVMKCEDVPDVDAFIAAASDSDFEGWVEVDVGAGQVATSGQVWLYADPDAPPDCDTCFICDYFFIQAEDNFGAQSSVVHRHFMRGNHPPETYVTVPRGAQVTGSCCEFQFSTLGIRVSWEGMDTLDYPGRQPDFYYAWEVYGPFEGFIDTAGQAIPDTVDKNWDEYLIEASWDSRAGSRWVMDQSVTLYNLFRYAQSQGETVYGYFVFKVRSRDDAYVEDPSPDIGTFMAIQPECENDIMLIDMTNYALPGPASLYAGGPCTGLQDSVYQPYFIEVVEEAYGGEIDAFYDAHDRGIRPPSIEEYSRYKLIIILAEDAWNGTSAEWFAFIYTYLQMGGKVMLMGVDHFIWTDQPTIFSQLLELQAPATSSITALVAREFFDIRKQWLTNYVGSTRRGDQPTNEEFVEGLSTVPDLPDVQPDSARLAHLTNLGYTPCRTGVPYPWHEDAIPGVNYFISGGRAERIYVARSAYGSQPPWGEGIDGGPCAFRHSSACHKAAIFGFPLWPLEREDAVGLLRGMIEWFDID